MVPPAQGFVTHDSRYLDLLFVLYSSKSQDFLSLFSVVFVSLKKILIIIIIWRNKHTTMNLNVLDEDNNKRRRLLAAVATSVVISSKTKKFIVVGRTKKT